MSQLPTLGWSPSAVLNIITAGNDISCAGTTLKGLPCGWDLGGDLKREVRNLLMSMSQRSPREALDDLPQLARLCLCQKNHQPQAAKVVARWSVLIEEYASSLKGKDTARTHRRSNSGDRETRSGRPILSIEEIIAELNDLSIRQKELQSMVKSIIQDAHLGDGHEESMNRLARTSPSQNTTHLVNQTQRSDSGSSRARKDQRRSSSSSRDGW